MIANIFDLAWTTKYQTKKSSLVFTISKDLSKYSIDILNKNSVLKNSCYTLEKRTIKPPILYRGLICTLVYTMVYCTCINRQWSIYVHYINEKFNNVFTFFQLFYGILYQSAIKKVE